MGTTLVYKVCGWLVWIDNFGGGDWGLGSPLLRFGIPR